MQCRLPCRSLVQYGSEHRSPRSGQILKTTAFADAAFTVGHLFFLSCLDSLSKHRKFHCIEAALFYPIASTTRPTIENQTPATADAPATSNTKQGKLTKKAEAKAARVAAKAEAKAERAAQKAKVKADKENAKTLAEMAEAKVLKELSHSLKTHARSATFACGGSVAFKTTSAGETDVDGRTDADDKPSIEQSTSKTKDDAGNAEEEPVDPSNTISAIDTIQVRFGKTDQGITVLFDQAGIPHADIDKLVAACQPATFGLDGKDVLDEDYRKAGKLDKADFATSFCPYEAGIIDVITQLLVPQFEHEKHSRSIRVSWR